MQTNYIHKIIFNLCCYLYAYFPIKPGLTQIKIQLRKANLGIELGLPRYILIYIYFLVLIYWIWMTLCVTFMCLYRVHCQLLQVFTRRSQESNEETSCRMCSFWCHRMRRKSTLQSKCPVRVLVLNRISMVHFNGTDCHAATTLANNVPFLMFHLAWFFLAIGHYF
jgi:hypothetical protein